MDSSPASPVGTSDCKAVKSDSSWSDFRSEAAAVRDGMLEGLARLRGDVADDRFLEQTRLLAAGSQRAPAMDRSHPSPTQDLTELQRELQNQQEQIRRVTYTLDRQVSRLSRELDLMRDQKETVQQTAVTGDADWRLREDVDALSRRVDGLEAFCRSPTEDSASQKSSLQSQLQRLQREMKELQEECQLERTRDVAGVRARAAVEQLAEQQLKQTAANQAEQQRLSSAVEALDRQIQMITSMLSDREGEPRSSIRNPIGQGELSLDELVREVIESHKASYRQHLAEAAADIRGEAAARCAELRAEMLARLEVLESQSLAHDSRQSQMSSQDGQMLQQSPSGLLTPHSSGSYQPLLSSREQPQALVKEDLKVALDRLVGKVNKTLANELMAVGDASGVMQADASVSVASGSDLQASTEVFRRCLQELRQESEVLQRQTDMFPNGFSSEPERLSASTAPLQSHRHMHVQGARQAAAIPQRSQARSPSPLAPRGYLPMASSQSTVADLGRYPPMTNGPASLPPARPASAWHPWSGGK
eukprot:TRINITY_DN48224_c0_g1_i1.p1 TRINITY_DN48224_c0_g1~~TRINITY_DN48224_c0_g1_i1.p1  ORF type:complete len:544 (+),score=123.95 TRINITY_DN48224_c0_g1_i1:32-1633(+)